MSMKRFTEDERRAAFEAKVERGDPDACWRWLGAIGGRGYGNFGFDGRTVAAHRVAFYLANGRWPKLACHTCDNKACVNPAHLYDGDKSSNQLDYYQRDPRAELQRQKSAELTAQRNRERVYPVNYCAVAGCGQKVAGRGLCMKHYDQARRGRRGTAAASSGEWRGGPCQ